MSLTAISFLILRKIQYKYFLSAPNLQTLLITFY